jgi:DNA-binding NarL/FixJ family response regulator
MTGRALPSPSGVVRVLVVEEHQILLWGIEKLIESQWPRMIVVGTARTCQEALTRTRDVSPDVIFLNLELAGLRIAEFLPELLSGGLSRVLAFTATEDTDLLDLAVRQGVRGIVNKEVSSGAFLKAIEKIHHGELWFDAGTMNRVFGQLLGGHIPSSSTTISKKHGHLTARERAIVTATVEHGGSGNYVLAERLFISEHTLRNHFTSIYRKLDVTNRLEMCVYALRHGLANVTPTGELTTR